MANDGQGAPRALVTGAGGGLGRHLAVDFARRGCRIAIADLNAARTWPNPVVTTVEPAPKFFVAEAYHQEYYANNSSQSYCRFVVEPKVQKFMKAFPQKMKA